MTALMSENGFLISDQRVAVVSVAPEPSSLDCSDRDTFPLWDRGPTVNQMAVSFVSSIEATRVSNRNALSFECLYETHCSRVNRLCRLLPKNTTEAEETGQEISLICQELFAALINEHKAKSAGG